MPAETSQRMDKPKTKSGSRRLLLGLTIICALLFAGWSVFWYFSYTTTQQLVDRIVAREVNGQRVMTCGDRALGGYPVRLALDCSSYSIRDPDSGWQISGGPVQVYWQLNAPDRASVETSAPLHIEQAMLGQSLEVTGSRIQGSVMLTPPDIVRAVSFSAEDATLSASNTAFGPSFGAIRANALSVDASPNPEAGGDLDMSFKASELSIDQIPILNGEMTFTAVEGLSALMRDRRDPTELWLQQSGRIRDIDGWMKIGQKTLKLKGDIAFSQAGLANGTLMLRILNPTIDTARIKSELTAKRDGFNGPLTGLQLMGKPVKDGDMVGSEVKITLTNGAIKAGFLPLGTLPPIR